MSADRSSRTHGLKLSLAAELRDELELGPEESLRVLKRTPRTITLERLGDDGFCAVPWDRELVLTADVQSFPLADLLHLLHRTGKSGFVALRCEKVEKTIHLHHGEVIFASSNQTGDRLGETLMRAGLITLDALRETERRYAPPLQFGKALVEYGALTPRQLWQGVKFQVEEIVRSLFAYNAGVLHFWEGDVQPDNVVTLSLPTERLIAEGLERRDELLRLVAHLEDSRVVLVRVDGMGDTLSGTGRTVYDVLEARDGFQALCRRAGFDPLSTARTLQLLKQVGAVEIEVGIDPDSLLVDSERRSVEDEGLRERVRDYVKLLGELVAPIVAIEGEAGVRGRVRELLSDVARAHPALLDGVELGAGCVLDPEAIAERALRLTGNREAVVTSALGELVSYIEFELKNHPAIDDAERFLEAVEDLRAKL